MTNTPKTKEVKIINSLGKKFKADWGVSMINAPKIWSKTKGEGVKVAVIDTGVDTNHPDLKNNIKSAIDMHTKTVGVTDEYGHGTMVAGLIAGKRTGVAPNADLYVAKVLNSKGLGSMEHVMDGVTFAINNKVDILCISLGVDKKHPLLLEERIKEAYRNGIIIVCATGNSGTKPPEYPASYDFVIGVGGVDRRRNRADFSNFGVEMDVVAPAVDILSTHLNGKYARMTGTSFSAPLVAGGIALLKSYYRKQGKELTFEDVIELFKNLSDKKTKEYGYGIFDLTKLMD